MISVNPLPPASELITSSSPELLAIAKDLAVSTRSWPGMTWPTRRTCELMVASDRFEAWVIAWPPGGSIELHDHGGSAGAVVVASGQLTETTLFELKGQEVEIETTTLTAGESMTVAPNDIHDVANLGAVPAISVHVYSPRLTAMTFYQITHRRLQVNRTVSYRLGEANP